MNPDVGLHFRLSDLADVAVLFDIRQAAIRELSLTHLSYREAATWAEHGGIPRVEKAIRKDEVWVTTPCLRTTLRSWPSVFRNASDSFPLKRCERSTMASYHSLRMKLLDLTGGARGTSGLERSSKYDGRSTEGRAVDRGIAIESAWRPSPETSHWAASTVYVAVASRVMTNPGLRLAGR